MTQITNADVHHWAPISQVMDWLCRTIPEGAKVLELGPGHTPFARATEFVDFRTDVTRPNTHAVDFATEPLPFADKSFDFVFCRHTLEDMWNPFNAVREMSRVGKAGYIETPSPVAELCRGVDGGSPHYRGYHHHRFMCWSHQGALRFISKYPLIEYLSFDDTGLARSLKSGPRYWNTYHLWGGQIDWAHRQSPLDFDIPRDYRTLLSLAVDQSKASSDEFFARLPAQSMSNSLQRAFA